MELGKSFVVFIVNPAIKKVYPISEANGKLVGFTFDDVDWDNVNQLEHNADAKKLIADYGGLSIGDYQDGVARIDWMLYQMGDILQMKIASEWRIMTK